MKGIAGNYPNTQIRDNTMSGTMNSVDVNPAEDHLMRFLAVEGLPGQEKAIGEAVIAELKRVGVPVSAIRFDKVNERIPAPTQTGNLFVDLPGTRKGQRLLFITHLDTVPLCAGAKPKREGDRIVSDGTTALGGDNRTGCAVLVTLVETLLKHKLPHPPISLLFAVHEESGIQGCRSLDPADLNGATMGFNVDSKLAAKQIARRRRVEQARTELRHRLVRAQEEEHRRIARELHDDLTQRLAVLAIEAGKLEQVPGHGEDVVARARGIREQLVALSEIVHSLSRQLHPSILDDLGLVDALGSECLSLHQRDGVTVDYHAQNVPLDLSRDVALCFYRVAQEALRNVARHARCSEASVRLVADEREMVLCVQDRGVGFDIGGVGKTGLGLESIRERACLIQARLVVRSRPGKGTRVILRVPLQRRSQR
jgi:signal transduction histidine kinase